MEKDKFIKLDEMTNRELNAKLVRLNEFIEAEHRANNTSLRWHYLCKLQDKLNEEARKRAKHVDLSDVARDELGIIL